MRDITPKSQGGVPSTHYAWSSQKKRIQSFCAWTLSLLAQNVRAHSTDCLVPKQEKACISYTAADT